MKEINNRRAGRTLSLTLLLASALFCLTAIPAHAARIHRLLSTVELPDGSSPYQVAINQTTHHFYVTTLGSGYPIYNFDSNGKLDSTLPELSETESLRPLYVGVDNSGGAHDGYIYASSVFSKAIQQYDPSGTPTSVKITDAALPPNGTPQGGGLPPVAHESGSESFGPRALAVGPSGDIYAYDQSNRAIDVFTPAGAFVAQWNHGNSANGLAFDAAGNLYYGGTGNGVTGLFELNPAGECVPASCEPIAEKGPLVSGRAEGIAVDRGAGGIFMTGHTEAAEEGEFSEFGLAGNLLGVTLVLEQDGVRYSPRGIGVDEASSNLIVAVYPQAGIGEHAVRIYGPAVVVPDVETEAAGSVDDHSAVFHGKIGAAEVPGATCVFQYVDEAGFKVQGFQGASEASCEPGGPFSGSAMNEVHAEVSGLRGGTTYHYRLLGTNENGSYAGGDLPFKTLGPTITSEEAAEVTEAVATLRGRVDPNGSPTTYRFQYVSQADFEASGYASATDVPGTPQEVPFAATGIGQIEAGSKAVLGTVTASGAFAAGQSLYGQGIAAETKITSVEEGKLNLSKPATETLAGAELTASSPQPVSAEVKGLAAATGYRFRILAESGASTTRGPDEAFRTFAPYPGGLPDGRAYEQASPTEKSGSNVEGELNAVQASRDGDRITFFASTGIPGGEGEQFFPSYLATRAPDGSGWATQGLLPAASAGAIARTFGWNEELTAAYDYATEAGAPVKLVERSSEGGSLTEVGSSGVLKSRYPFAYAGASSGGGVALLESETGELLPDDRTEKQNVYVYDRGEERLVLAGVMNDGSAPAGGTMAGSYGDGPGSKGGAWAGYFTRETHTISTDGRRVFFTEGGSGQLYVRENPLAQQSLMNGEECAEAAAKACTIRISAPEEGVADPGTPAVFAWASADGSVVYFLDKGKLTEDSTAGTGRDLYRYDVETGELTDLTVDAVDKNGAEVQGMLGVGASGDDAYFVAVGALASGASRAPSGEVNLYALHGDGIEFISRLSTEAGFNSDKLDWTPVSKSDGNETVVHASRVSEDGQRLLFSSKLDLTGYHSHDEAELYLYRTGEGIECISCNPSGEAPLGPAGVQLIPKKAPAPSLQGAIMTRNLSTDGRRVVFDTADRLVSADENGVNDVYEWEEEGEGSCQGEEQAGGCLYLISGGRDGYASYFGDADPEGKNVFIFTKEPLLAQDKDELEDVYDARIGGGIAAQNREPVAPCEGEACLAAGSSGREAQAPGSASFSGPANPTRPSACAKGRTRRHGRCVKPKKRHAKKKHKKHSRKHGKQRRSARRARGGQGK